MMTKTTNEDIDILTRTLYGEARGESDAGVQAVANVIKNRAGLTKSIKSVCLKPYQFSCWNEGDPNKSIITNLSVQDTTYQRCFNIAKRVVNGSLTDNTNGANHYHTSNIKPYWADDTKITAIIGHHIFYKL
ncbi:MAG: Cell Wall Hydrolase [Alphaproteobacteria bacterium ADurb.Bin438]|nr:MAG: Cell Wall Hydrolase [Alphaproteobacteria bacterium ADurb.Bin438]